MIIGMSLKEIFKDKTILVDSQEISVQFHFGDQKEFNYWVATKMKSQKYPLIWYVINAPTPLGSGKLKVDSQLILFQGTKSEILNTTRYEQTYLKYIEPLYELVNKTLTEHRYVTLLNSGKPIPYKDEPNFGVETNNPLLTSNDFATTTSKQTKSIGIVLVDAKILRLSMEITPKCIISNSSVTPPVTPPFVCSGGNKYIQISNSFSNPFVPSLNTVIKNLTTNEIIDIWLNNNDYANGVGGLDIFICTDRFELGTTIRFSNSSEIMPNNNTWNGYWIANQSGYSGNAILNGVEIEYRFNPNRSTPYNLANPITNPPLPFSFFSDTVEPIIIKVENGVVTEITELPMTGFVYEG